MASNGSADSALREAYRTGNRETARWTLRGSNSFLRHVVHCSSEIMAAMGERRKETVLSITNHGSLQGISPHTHPSRQYREVGLICKQLADEDEMRVIATCFKETQADSTRCHSEVEMCQSERTRAAGIPKAGM